MAKDEARPRIVTVGVAQLAVVKRPDLLQTQALGSCVGVVLYEQNAAVGGMSHAMLPLIERSRTSSRMQKAKFVDSAIDLLVEEMVRSGAKERAIKAKLAGGANMFPDIERRLQEHIGAQNVRSAKYKLKELGIPLISEDTGGTVGRTITFDTDTWELTISSVLLKDKVI